MDQKISAALGGEFMSLGASSSAEESLHARGAGALATAVRLLADTVEEHEFAAEYRYCQTSVFKHPIPVLTVCARNGAYVVPSADLLTSIDMVTRVSTDSTDVGPRRRGPTTQIIVEEFPKESPVKCLIVPRTSQGEGMKLVAIFSDDARRQACRQAAQALRGTLPKSYSYVLHEVIEREARTRLGAASESANVELVDDGTLPAGEVFKVIAHVREGDRDLSIPLHGSVQEEGIAMVFVERDRPRR